MPIEATKPQPNAKPSNISDFGRMIFPLEFRVPQAWLAASTPRGEWSGTESLTARIASYGRKRNLVGFFGTINKSGSSKSPRRQGRRSLTRA